MVLSNCPSAKKRKRGKERRERKNNQRGTDNVVATIDWNFSFLPPPFLAIFSLSLLLYSPRSTPPLVAEPPFFYYCICYKCASHLANDFFFLFSFSLNPYFFGCGGCVCDRGGGGCKWEGRFSFQNRLHKYQGDGVICTNISPLPCYQGKRKNDLCFCYTPLLWWLSYLYSFHCFLFLSRLVC